jgi:DNA repair protein RecN (Recombination protein N)
LAEVAAFGEDVARKLNGVINRDEVLKDLRKQLAAAGEKYLSAARAVSRKRFAAAKELEKLVEAEVNDLAMKATFRVQVGGADEPQNWTAIGFDEVQFLIATNAGEPPRPLDQIASGGEMSRVMLSLKVAIQKGVSKGNGSRRSARKPMTLVFDEIDTGIGGRAAEAVGKKLKTLAHGDQVLCVTHLPQIASFADRHFCIEKREHGGRARTSIVALAAEERTREIARMLSGAKVTDASIKNAEQMLKANA